MYVPIVTVDTKLKLGFVHNFNQFLMVEAVTNH
jgi:hypothetical protein